MSGHQATFGRQQGRSGPHQRQPHTNRGPQAPAAPALSARAARAVERSRSIARKALDNAQRRRADVIHQLNESAKKYPVGQNPTQELFDSDQPKIDMFVDEVGTAAHKIMTPFTFDAFERLWHLVGPEIEMKWRNGKGPPVETSPKDAFFIMLNVLSPGLVVFATS